MALAIVLDRLKNNLGPMSYGELAKQMQTRFGERVQPNKQKYGHPLGAAAQVAIDKGKEHGMVVPPLSVIVIREDIGYPGVGADWFVSRLRNQKYDLKDPRRLSVLDAETNRVWAFGSARWEHLERLLGLAPLPIPRVGPKGVGKPPKIKRFRGGEGEAHAALKRWIADHPERLKDFGHYTRGTVEELLCSGDSIDAMLFGVSDRLAVEVKASNASQDELIRGIFQCVKYRSTMQAEAHAYPDKRLPGACVLISTVALSERAQAVADALAIPFLRVPRRCERYR